MPARARQRLEAAMELAYRASLCTLGGIQINGPQSLELLYPALVNLIGYEPREYFAAVWLNSQHYVITVEIISEGTVDSASVYPREVVRRALEVNAAAVIFAHNHPSGTAEPSRADRYITDKLDSALALVGVRTLDHAVVGAGSIKSAKYV